MHSRKSLFCAPLAGALLSLCAASVHAAGMEVKSESWADGASIPKQFGHNGTGSDGSQCGGGGVSPQISWSNLPPNAKSIAIFMYDPDNAAIPGASHWVAYNIPAERGQLRQGDPGVTLGKNVRGEAAYRGPCPTAGQVAHHYVTTVYATDLAPNSLPAGMTREELLAALKGHALEAQSFVGRFAR